MLFYQNYFTLAKEMTLSDFKLRYHGSLLGVFWSFLRPMALFAVLYIVFSVFIRFDIPHYPLYLLLGIILWNFFSEATLLSLNNLAGKAALIKKIPFPRSIIIVSATCTVFLTLLMNLAVFFIFFAFSSLKFSWTMLLAPVFIIELYFISLGTSLFISALYAKFKDIRYIWEVTLQLIFWISPIIYSIEMIPQKFHFAVYLNPLTRIIQYTREALLLEKIPNLDGMTALSLMTLFIVFFGYIIFKKRSPYFAEEL